MTQLASAIENLYTAFGDVEKPTVIEACPCCLTSEEIKTLLTKPLRELAPSEISSYSSDALFTVGSVADYVYFLPRILDISINDEMWWPDIEVSAKKIKSLVQAGLNADKIFALSDFFDKAIEQILITGKYHRLDEWICGTASANFDVRLALTKIESNSDAVIEYFNSNAKELQRNRLSNAFWVLPDPKHDEIVAWFKSEPISEMLLSSYGYKT